ncbi:MAG: glycosyltransferase family 2 protein [Phyllobacterium sp.]
MFVDRHTSPSDRIGKHAALAGRGTDASRGNESSGEPDARPADLTQQRDKTIFRTLAALAVRFEKAGLDRSLIVKAYGASVANGTSFKTEIQAAGLATEREVGLVMAEELKLPFEEIPDPGQVVLRPADSSTVQDIRQVMVDNGEGAALVYIAPRLEDVEHLKAQTSRSDDLARRLRVTTPSNLQSSLRARQSKEMAGRAIGLVEAVSPRFSARMVASAGQGVALGMAFVLAPAALWIDAAGSLLAVHLFCLFFFYACIAIRLLAAMAAKRMALRPLKPVAARDLPQYTVLVALHHEAEVVPQLIAALSRLRWPRSKLEIKLVCEADDKATISAIGRCTLPHGFEVVAVPVVGPRTKPKALNYALLASKGDFVVIYDAEDRPHPDQLLEAWEVFSDADSTLACVQAPLIISNIDENWLARLFALEYAALFRGLLPWLAQNRFVIPLGGTSNHFRRSHLETVGGWDPFNVTEDADLGLRFARFGYRTDVITRGTLEDAPTRTDIWTRQRTRWLKGWMQTWLVHMREPARFWKELGPANFIANQLLMTGVLLSTLFHPLMLLSVLTLGILMLTDGYASTKDVFLLTMDGVAIATSYLAFHWLGKAAMTERERRQGPFLVWIPCYWFLMSFAAWRALWQLHKAPFLWEKTPHKPSRTGDALYQRWDEGSVSPPEANGRIILAAE